MLETIVARIAKRGSNIPTRQDIAELMSSVSGPGFKRIEKQILVKQLFQRTGASPSNGQGHSVIDSLDEYGEY